MMTRTKERIVAICDNRGVVKNLIVVGESWNSGGIDTGESVVNLGDVFDGGANRFCKSDGLPCLTWTEVKALPKAHLSHEETLKAIEAELKKC
jgi:hypothetical protein